MKSSPCTRSGTINYICFMYVYVCLSSGGASGAAGGGGGALKQAPYSYHGNVVL